MGDSTYKMSNVRIVPSTVSTVFLSEGCKNGSKFHQE